MFGLFEAFEIRGDFGWNLFCPGVGFRKILFSNTRAADRKFGVVFGFKKSSSKCHCGKRFK
jgi:hypothetical protein